MCRLLLAVFRTPSENPWATASAAAIRHLVPPPTPVGRRSRTDSFGAIRPVSGKFRVQVNAWLLEDFDPDAQPIN
jgi:hypothetical protein